MSKFSPSAKRVVKIAAKEVGYREGRNKVTRRWNNRQKYSKSVPALEWSYGQPWCATFVSWVAMRAKRADRYPRTASCDVAANWFLSRNQWSEYPAVGAQIFFGTKDDLVHTGIVEDYNDEYVYTIEGNTNDSGSREGDGVYRRRRRRRDAYVVGYGYPKFIRPLDSADPNYVKNPWTKSRKSNK